MPLLLLAVVVAAAMVVTVVVVVAAGVQGFVPAVDAAVLLRRINEVFRS